MPLKNLKQGFFPAFSLFSKRSWDDFPGFRKPKKTLRRSSIFTNKIANIQAGLQDISAFERRIRMIETEVN